MVYEKLGKIASALDKALHIDRQVTDRQTALLNSGPEALGQD